MKKKVLIVLGGNSREREISIKTGKACMKAIKRLGYKTITFDPKKQLFIDILKIKANGTKKNKTNHKYGVNTNHTFCFFKFLIIKEIY